MKNRPGKQRVPQFRFIPPQTPAEDRVKDQTGLGATPCKSQSGALCARMRCRVADVKRSNEMNDLIDDLSRILASPIPRRRALRLAGGMVGGSLLAFLGWGGLPAGWEIRRAATAGLLVAGAVANLRRCAATESATAGLSRNSRVAAATGFAANRPKSVVMTAVARGRTPAAALTAVLLAVPAATANVALPVRSAAETRVARQGMFVAMTGACRRGPRQATHVRPNPSPKSEFQGPDSHRSAGGDALGSFKT